MNDTHSVESAYRSAFESALIVQHDSPGLLHVRGEDRLDLLNRMSTNDLEHLPVSRERSTVFTDPVGRTIDVVTVLSLHEELLLLATAGRADVLRAWLERHIFFQDDVQLELPEEQWSLFGAYGPLASESIRLDKPARGELTASHSSIVWPVSRPVAGYLILLRPGAETEPLTNHSEREGNALAYEILRIEAGQPKMGQDIFEDSIPLEVGLWDAVSFEKGCYVGQEIIARMESRGRLAKQLVGIRLKAEASAGAALSQGDRMVGSLTSVVHSPRLGWIGLGTVKTKALSEHDRALRIGENAVSGEWVDLPFAAAVPIPSAERAPQA